MNEYAWINCKQAIKMIEFLRNGNSKDSGKTLAGYPVLFQGRFPCLTDRKQRLVAVYAATEIQKIQSKLEGPTVDFCRQFRDAIYQGKLIAENGWMSEYEYIGKNFWVCMNSTTLSIDNAIRVSSLDPYSTYEQLDLSLVIREVFGNPFVTYEIPPHVFQWNGGKVRKIAQTIYNSEQFNELPILADAVEEAGLTNEDIIQHLRRREKCWKCGGDGRIINSREAIKIVQENYGNDHLDALIPMIRSGAIASKKCECNGGYYPMRGIHIRGCWALDLILGKHYEEKK